jgi:hypothetical protein
LRGAQEIFAIPAYKCRFYVHFARSAEIFLQFQRRNAASRYILRGVQEKFCNSSIEIQLLGTFCAQRKKIFGFLTYKCNFQLHFTRNEPKFCDYELRDFRDIIFKNGTISARRDRVPKTGRSRKTRDVCPLEARGRASWC